MEGAEKKTVNSAEHFNELFTIGKQNRITQENQYGKMSEKATAVLTLEVIQIIETGGETQVLVSKVMFIDFPATEALQQGNGMQQTANLNKGLFAIQDVMLDLASGSVLLI